MKWWIGVVSTCCVALLVLFFARPISENGTHTKRPTPSRDTSRTLQSEEKKFTHAVPQAYQPDTVLSSNSGVFPPDALLSSLPTSEGMRKEVTKNPHLPPDSLIRFTQSLTREVKAARQSKEKATKVFDSLKACLKGVAPSTVHYMCLRNARELADYYQYEKEDDSFMNAYELLEESASEETLEKLELMEELE